MKRILVAFLSVFFVNVVLADNLLHINSNIVGEIVKKHIPPTKQPQALFEYNQIVKEHGGITPYEIRRVCAAAGWQIDFAHAMTDGEKCDAFVEDLLKNASVKLYEVCGREKGKSGETEKCVNDFQALSTNMIQATGLAKLYAYHKDKTEKVVCNNTARNETTNNTSTIRGGMNAGMAPATAMNTHYVQCKSLDKNIFYEFKFDNTRGTNDSTNHHSFKTGICSVFGYKFQGATKKDNREKSGWDICDGATQNACGMINNALVKAHSGYFASWGPLGRTLSTGKHGKVNEAGAGYELNASQLPYCILTANAGVKYDGTAYERTAFGLDGRHFLTSDIQIQGTAELHEYIRKYVVSRGIQIKEFSCAETYVTVKLAGRPDSDDMISCTINGSTVDFFFDDLSESKDKYIRGAKQALDCMVSGGTFTGKKCIGLGKEQCEVVRATNAISCPECKQIKWNSETNICELPASASASQLKRGLNYTAIVGGAVVGIVITVGTLGTSSAPTVAILGGVGIETAGSVIELITQMRIDEKADKFFTQSANCKNQTCAEKLIKDYLQELANQSDSLLDSELTTADEEFARLFGLIPPKSEFYTEIIKKGIRGGTVESNKRGIFETGSWNSDQIWRAVGIGLQILPAAASVGWKIAKKSDKLVKSTAKLRVNLDVASKYIDNALGITKRTKIGFLDTTFITKLDTDDFIKNLEKDGYSVEIVGQKGPYKLYDIFTNAEKDIDIEQLQKDFLKQASSNADKDVRLTALGNYYAYLEHDAPDSWYNTYEEIITSYLSQDPDIAQAYTNWHKMSTTERFDFIDKTNRKIRHLISEEPLIVSYNRPPNNGAASYNPSRIGSTAQLLGHDTYGFRPESQDRFEDILDNLIHENYHYCQDIGKTQLPKWLADFNLDNYIQPNEHLLSEYKVQPLERPAQAIGKKVSKNVLNNLIKQRIESLRDVATHFKQAENPRLQELGQIMESFINNKSRASWSKWKEAAQNLQSDLRFDRINLPKQDVDYIKSFDRDFFDIVRNTYSF